MTQRVQDVMTKDPITLPEDTSIIEAARRMRDDGVGNVIVTGGDGRIAGLVTDRDLVMRIVAEGRNVETSTLADARSGDVVTVPSDDSADDVVRLMRERAIRRVPVVDGDRVVGIVSIGDLAVDREPESALADISAADPNA